ncbi:hypothetical protein Tco_0962502 [Tanacetum coccineum]
MFEVSTILEDDSAELVSGGANRFFSEVLGEGVSLPIEEEKDALAVSGGSRVVVEIGVDTTLGDLKYSSNIG